MALWHVSFQLLPKSLIGDLSELPEGMFAIYFGQEEGPIPTFCLPFDYASQVADFLPAKASWSPDIETWGYVHSDDIQILREESKIVEIRFRVDVRKLDDGLLSRFLALANEWACVLIEARYGTVCKMEVPELRTLIAGHPHSRAMQDPKEWLPVLAEEVRKKEEET